MHEYEAVVVGAGPNGLAAATVLARSGVGTLVLEAGAEIGGGTRTQPLTLPGFSHDVCSTVHPLGVASPLFKALELSEHGVTWIESPAALAHVLDDETVVTLERSLDATAEQFGADAGAYLELMQPYLPHFDALTRMVLGPLRLPRHPLLLARFGLTALRSMRSLGRDFQSPAARALLAGISAHAMLPLDAAATASFALVLGLAGHAVGWPLAHGGSQSIAGALQRCLLAAGGSVETNRHVAHFDELPRARAYLFDVTPRQLLAILGERLPGGFRQRLRAFRYGPGVYKLDWALAAPTPFRHPACARAATVHLAGTLEEIAHSEAASHGGGAAERPFVLFVQPSLFDGTRAPDGRHVAWAYCHVPHGWPTPAHEAIEARIERYAPGFRDLVLARASKDPQAMELYNPNYVGGDINGGLSDLRQLFFRPIVQIDPYATALPNVFLCSSSTPPGGGVHGMCGYWAARSALQKVFGRRPAEELDFA